MAVVNQICLSRNTCPPPTWRRASGLELEWLASLSLLDISHRYFLSGERPLWILDAFCKTHDRVDNQDEKLWSS
jgi:hypothetical protein